MGEDIPNVVAKVELMPIPRERESSGSGIGYSAVTTRQAQFLAEFSSGSNLRDLAEKYYYTYGGVVWHFKEIKRKLGAQSITHACVLAVTNGIISYPTGMDNHCISLK